MSASTEHLANLERIAEETLADGRGVLEAMCRAAGPANWDRPLEALEMYAAARSFMEEEVAELVNVMRTHYTPAFSWDEIALRLGMSRQSAWTKYRSGEEGVTRLRQRPGPRTSEDVVEFVFVVNASYDRRGELTIPTSFNGVLNERLPGEGPSWGASIQRGDVRDAIKIRRGHNQSTRYYQLRVPKDVRARLALRMQQRVEVRLPLLGPLLVVLD